MIGVFDSGVGGLSVLRVLRQLLPQHPFLYVADQAHVPYGPRPSTEIRIFSEQITQFLVAQGVELVVVACNTATAAALGHLRERYPNLPFVGMEPAVKPAAVQTRTGVVGVLATAGTFQSQRYASLTARFAAHVRLLENPCVGLVEQIERGELTTAATESLLRAIVAPMVAQGADTFILGCTHYPFIRPLLAHILGPEVAIIDPAPAVARQVARLLPAAGSSASPALRVFTTAAPHHLQTQIAALLGWHTMVEQLPIAKS